MDASSPGRHEPFDGRRDTNVAPTPGTDARAPHPRAGEPDVGITSREHAVLAAALDPILTIDAYGTIQSASNSVERVFGWTSGELVGRNINILMPEPHHSGHDGYLANYRLTGRTNIMGRTREFECVRRSGERFPIELSVSRVEQDRGGMPLFVGIIRDISERRRLERELRLVQELALAISGATSLKTALIETLRRICEATAWDYAEAWLPATDESTTHPGDTLTTSLHVNELVGFVSWMRPESGLAEFARSCGAVRLRVGRGLPGRAWESGRPIWVTDLGALPQDQFCRPALAAQAGLRAAAVVPVLSEGRPIAALVFFVRHTRQEDLHLLELVRVAVAPVGEMIQRKGIEEQLAQHRRELEHRVELRTRELKASQEKLRMADRMASIGTLAAGLGHDMNNVLLPVRAHLNALRASGQEGSLAAPDRKHVEAIRKSVGYLQQLADGLHFLAMDPDAGEDVRGGGAVTDLTQWWSQAGALLSKSVPRHVQVTCTIPDGLPSVRVPAHGLTQAALNLIVNAGEAIPPPSVRKRRQGRVRVGASLEPDGAHVRIAITDNGTGMTEEVKRRAFELFFTTKPRGLGTGLGLSLVQKVVDGAGGHVEIETEVGKGTTVSMLIPAVAAAPSDQAARDAIVLTADGRAGALIRHLLESSGVRVRSDGRGEASDLWIIEPTEAMLTEAKRWRSSRPHARVVLVGRAEAAHEPDWRSMAPVVIEDPHDVEALRAALARATAPT